MGQEKWQPPLLGRRGGTWFSEEGFKKSGASFFPIHLAIYLGQKQGRKGIQKTPQSADLERGKNNCKVWVSDMSRWCVEFSSLLHD